MKFLSLLLLFAVLLSSPVMLAQASPAGPQTAERPCPEAVRETPDLTSADLKSDPAEAGRWVCKRTDNVCGLDDALMLSKPAKIDYESALKATAEMKKMRDKGIDPKSPEGIQLRIEAQNAVKKAALKIAQENGYCSVWKKISHTDGRRITDITALVKAKF